MNEKCCLRPWASYCKIKFSTVIITMYYIESCTTIHTNDAFYQHNIELLGQNPPSQQWQHGSGYTIINAQNCNEFRTEGCGVEFGNIAHGYRYWSTHSENHEIKILLIR